MAGNKTLGRAKEAKNDEFYTQFADIEREVNAYLAYNPDVFRDKTVLLPCDDPEWSNFTRYFAQNFTSLGLKRLISTGYAIESKRRKGLLPGLFPEEDSAGPGATHGKIFVLDRDTDGNGIVDLDDLEWRWLDGDGDFQSEEVGMLRDEADIIVTNPPFSMFSEFVSWLIEGKKFFLIIGNLNSVSHKTIFPLIRSNSIWLGTGFANGNAYFGIPESSRTDYSKGVLDEASGLVKFRNCCWFTNLDHGQRHEPMRLMTMAENIRHSRHKDVRGHAYARYENYDAIEVPYVDAIPSDWDGVMGVPRSFLEHYNPDQFEIVGMDSKELSESLGIGPVGEDWVSRYRGAGGTGHITPNMRNLVLTVDGIPKMSYARILIRKRKENDE